jgi:hypothetical protein
MFNAHQLTSSRALEMLESGEMSDCVIEVQEQQNGGQDKKVFYLVYFMLLSYYRQGKEQKGRHVNWPRDSILMGIVVARMINLK